MNTSALVRELGKMSPAGWVRRGINGANKAAARRIVPRRVRPTRNESDLLKLGDGDGLWPVAPFPEGAVCYCVGVGRNATFDAALAARGAEVHSFDPTPHATEYMKTFDAPGVRFHPIGIWNEPTTLRFFAPADRRHANFSVVDLHGTGEAVEAECRRLVDVMADLGHTRLDLLKLDVEGSWGPILDDLIDSDIRPTQLCVEFDSPTSTGKILGMVRRLDAIGYDVAWFAREDFLFLHRGDGAGTDD